MKTLKQVQATVFISGRVVLLRKNDVKFEKGKWILLPQAYWRLPKGKLEGSETPVAGLKRELNEECGFRNVKRAKKVFYYEYESPKGTTRKVSSYYAETNEKPELTAGAKAEGITKITTATPSTALKKLHWNSEKQSLKAAVKTALRPRSSHRKPE